MIMFIHMLQSSYTVNNYSSGPDSPVRTNYATINTCGPFLFLHSSAGSRARVYVYADSVAQCDFAIWFDVNSHENLLSYQRGRVGCLAQGTQTRRPLAEGRFLQTHWAQGQKHKGGAGGATFSSKFVVYYSPTL